MTKLFALDSMATLYRNYFAMIRNPMVNSKGLNTSGIFGFFKQVVKIIEEEKPDYLAIVSDTAEPTFRHKQYPEYKANREKMPDDLVDQLPYLPKLIEALKLPYITMPGFEADDIIGTLMRLCHEKKISGTMVTGDKDYMQLITDLNVMLNPKGQKVGIKQVEEKFNCRPDQVIDILGLMGDASDNIPGVKGVGEKTAIKLISQFGSIPKLYASIDELPNNKMKEKLINDRDNAFLSRELVTIDTNVPIAFTFEDLKLNESKLYDNPTLINILEELEFKSLIKKYKSASISRAKSTDKTIPVDAPSDKKTEFVDFKSQVISSMAEYDQMIDEAAMSGVIALEVITSGPNILEMDIQKMVFSSNGFLCQVIDLTNPIFHGEQNSIFEKLKEVIISPKVTIALYNWKQILQWLRKFDITTGTNVFDMTLAAHLVETDTRDSSLDGIANRQLQYIRKYVKSNKKVTPLDGQVIIESEMNDQYVSESVLFLWLLQKHLKQQLIQTNMWQTYQYVEIKLAEVLANMEINGVKLDSKSLKHISTEFEGRLASLSQSVYQISESEFNINSIIELQTILYDKLKLHEAYKVKPKKIKLGNHLSTDEETLEKLQDHPLPKLILQYRELNKLKNTYVDQLPTFVNPHSGRIHSSFRQTVAATGRLASDKPNLQNIPIRTAEGRRIRAAFIPSKEKHVLISADYSQIELRVVAHFSKDPTFMAAYRQNLDIHTLTAAAIFKIPEESVTREMRSKAKEVNFGLIYRMGPERLSIITHSSKKEAKSFIERYFDKYATIHALQERFLAQAQKNGYAKTLLGRRRYLPNINARGFQKRLAEGAAINTPIQGSAAEIIKLAMVAIHNRLQKEHLKCRMILSVHDELVFDTPQNEVETVIELVKWEMENAITLEVPLIAEIGTGINWLEAH